MHSYSVPIPHKDGKTLIYIQTTRKRFNIDQQTLKVQTLTLPCVVVDCFATANVL